MRKTFKISLDDSKKFLGVFFKKVKKFLWNVGRNAFIFIIIFVLSGILFGEFLFYHYVLLAKVQTPEITSVSTKFKESIYRSVLMKWQDREDIFNNSSPNSFQDPFL